MSTDNSSECGFQRHYSSRKKLKNRKTLSDRRDSKATSRTAQLLDESETMFSWDKSKGAVPKKKPLNANKSSIIQSLAKSLEKIHLNAGQEIPQEKSVPFLENIPRQLTRTKSEPRRQSSDGFNRRTRPHVPLARDGKVKANPKSKTSFKTATYATKRLLSARKLKIDDLRNHIVDLERQLVKGEKENKLLQALAKRQQKELEKVEQSNMDIPELEKAHDNEIRSLKAMMRKFQDKNRELEERLNTKDEELQHTFKLCQKLRAALQQKTRDEGERDKRVNALKAKIKTQEETIKELENNLYALERKISGERVAHDSTALSLESIKKRYEGNNRRCFGKSKSKIQSFGSGTKEQSLMKIEDFSDSKAPEESSEDFGSIDMAKYIQRTQTTLISNEDFSKNTCHSTNISISPGSLALVPFLNKEMTKDNSSKNFHHDNHGPAFRSRMCLSAGSLTRHSSRAKCDDGKYSIDTPLIIPTSPPKQSTTESDSSSCQLPNPPDTRSYAIHKAHELFKTNVPKQNSPEAKNR